MVKIPTLYLKLLHIRVRYRCDKNRADILFYEQE
nr:MAG TPA: hypothetical protein [Caudoviricetes sp.]